MADIGAGRHPHGVQLAARLTMLPVTEDFEPGYHLAPHDNALNAALRAIGVYAVVGIDRGHLAGHRRAARRRGVREG